MTSSHLDAQISVTIYGKNDGFHC